MKKMLFGPPGRQVAIPYPDSGMGFGNNADSEVTELLSGGRHVYRAPTTYKTFNMSWKANTAGLQPLIDMYNGMYGPGPFYMTDPLAAKGNMLPPRWASSYLLAYIANGWGKPVIGNQTTTTTGKQVTFTNTGGSLEGVSRLVIPVEPGVRLYLKAWGTRTGSSAGIRVYGLAANNTWSLLTTYVPTLTNDTPATLLAVGHTYKAVRFSLYLPGSSTLTLMHADLSTTDYRDDPIGPFRGGQGVGAVQFTNRLDGQLTSTKVDRIGLSVDLTEVENDANFS